MKYVDTLQDLARDSVIKKLNLQELLDPNRDWDLIFDPGFDNNIANKLSEQMISGDLNYGDCLKIIQTTLYRMQFKHDEKFMREIDSLRNLPTNFLMFIWMRLPVIWFHYCVLFLLPMWKPNFPDWEKHSGDVQSLMDTCSPLLHPKMIELRNECTNWEYLATLNSFFDK